MADPPCLALAQVDDIKEVFEDLAVLVSDQDEAAEVLETNVGSTVEDVEAAGEQLLQAEGYQQRGRRCKLMLAAVLAAVVVVIVVLAVRGGG